MTTATLKFYPSAPLEKILEIEQRIKKKLKDVNSSNNSVINLKETITYLKDKSRKSG